MINTNLCCAKNHYNRYYVFIEELLITLTDKIKSQELFGDKSVHCNYDFLNDFMYLKEKLDIYLYDKSTNVSDVDKEKYCLEKTYNYFRSKGFDVSKLINLYL